MSGIKIESKREMFYLKYKKSNIFDLSPYKTERNEHSKIADKITNKRYDKIFKPKIDNLTSRQRYIQSLFKSDENELQYSQKKITPKIKRKDWRSNSAKHSIIKKKFDFNLIKEKKFNKNNHNLSFYRESSNNDKKIEKILRTTTNHKLRSFYSKFSDIFNINNSSSQDIKSNRSTLLGKKKITIKNLLKTSDELKFKIKPIPINLKKIKNTKNYFQKELNTRNNIIKSEREKEETLKKKVKEKMFNLKSNKKSENIKNEILPPIYKFKLNIKNNKTNINNLESVNYNIINNKTSTSREEYKNFSSIKPSFGEIINYEILIPKNYNKVSEIKLKNILHSEGIHFFNFSEQGDIIGGNKGKDRFKVRNSNNEKEFNDKIKKVNNKFSKINIKLNKLRENHSKKKTDLIQNPKNYKTSKFSYKKKK